MAIGGIVNGRAQHAQDTPCVQVPDAPRFVFTDSERKLLLRIRRNRPDCRRVHLRLDAQHRRGRGFGGIEMKKPQKYEQPKKKDAAILFH